MCTQCTNNDIHTCSCKFRTDLGLSEERAVGAPPSSDMCPALDDARQRRDEAAVPTARHTRRPSDCHSSQDRPHPRSLWCRHLVDTSNQGSYKKLKVKFKKFFLEETAFSRKFLVAFNVLVTFAHFNYNLYSNSP